ncbi:MAG: fibronectin type III domain-containing protein, partial [Dolichospermum sp.]
TTWSSFATTNLSRTLIGLLSSTAYEFQGKVRCSGSASGLWGTLGTFTTPAPLVVCTSPSTLNVSAVTATSANFSWTAMGAPTSSYLLRYRVVGATTWQNCGVGNNNSKVVGGLASGTNYEA